MSYRLYQTEGIILARRDIDEADRIFSVFTKDFGRINAVSQGVRYLKSKLRYNLEMFSWLRIGLVSGRDFWRIVDAEEINHLAGIKKNPLKISAASQIIQLLNRMVRGQERDANLWNEVKNSLIFLDDSDILGAAKNFKTFQLLTNLRILSHLGYVPDGGKWLGLPLKEAFGLEPQMASIIKKSIEESQL